MRIVGGEFRGRSLVPPRDDSIRPTTDRVRESLFSIIASRYHEQLRGNALDLFAGTGALGLEAMSRGAEFCLFMENSAQGQTLIRENIANLDLRERTKLFRSDATKPGKISNLKPFNLVFADPPYNKGLAEKAIAALHKGEWLARGAIIIVEEGSSVTLSEIDGCQMVDQRKFGDTSMSFYKANILAVWKITKS